MQDENELRFQAERFPGESPTEFLERVGLPLAEAVLKYTRPGTRLLVAAAKRDPQSIVLSYEELCSLREAEFLDLLKSGKLLAFSCDPFLESSVWKPIACRKFFDLRLSMQTFDRHPDSGVIERITFTPHNHAFVRIVDNRNKTALALHEGSGGPAPATKNKGGRKEEYPVEAAISEVIKQIELRKLPVPLRSGKHTELRNALESWFVETHNQRPAEASLGGYVRKAVGRYRRMQGA